MNMKKKMLYIAAILICLSVITGGTLAYYTTNAVARNQITMAGVQAEVSVDDTVVTPSVNLKIMPGVEVDYPVSASNSQVTAWIHMTYTMTIYDTNGEKMNVPADKLALMIPITPDTTHWVKQGDWWYHKDPVDTGMMTHPLFETITFSAEHMTNEYQGCTIEITVTTQAVQREYNGATVLDAAGWPVI